MKTILAMVSMALTVSCAQKEENACKNVVAHVGSITQRDVEESGDQKRLEQTLVTLPAALDALKKVCENEAWPDAIRRCILDANTVTALEACDPSSLRQQDEDAPITGAE